MPVNKKHQPCRIIDFNQHRIDKVITKMCTRYHEKREFFSQFVDHILTINPYPDPEYLEEELEFFMTLRSIERKK